MNLESNKVKDGEVMVKKYYRGIKAQSTKLDDKTATLV
jgi:hypothetical protein